MALPDESKKPRSRALDPEYRKQGKSKDQENRIAKKVGGRRQPGSGNRTLRKGDGGTATGYTAHGRDFRPGDVTHDKFLFEAKRTDAKSIRVEAHWLTTIDTQATMLGKLPALVIEIGGIASITEKDWCMVPMSVFNAMLGKGETDE